MMETRRATGLVNQVVFELDWVPDVTAPETFTRTADALIEGDLFLHPASEYLDAIDTVLTFDSLPAPTLGMNERVSAEDVLTYLRGVAAELRARLAEHTA
jgi:hypothetical protein